MASDFVGDIWMIEIVEGCVSLEWPNMGGVLKHRP